MDFRPITRGTSWPNRFGKYRPVKAVVTNDQQYQGVLAATTGWEGTLLSGPDGLLELVTDPAVDVVVSAVVGAAGSDRP